MSESKTYVLWAGNTPADGAIYCIVEGGFACQEKMTFPLGRFGDDSRRGD